MSAIESAVKVTFSGDVLRASATEQIESATVYDLSGIVLATKNPAATSVEFNLGAYSAKVYVLRCALAWAANSANAFAMKCDLLKSLKERFDIENIEIPYPYYNIKTC